MTSAEATIEPTAPASVDTIGEQLLEMIDADDAPAAQTSGRDATLNIDPDDVGRGLGQLVLTVARLVHELLERQAIRRIDNGSITDAEAERLGRTLMLQAEEIDKLADHFGMKTSDLNLDLGPLGKLI